MALGPGAIAFSSIPTEPLIQAIEGYSIYLQKSGLHEDTSPLVEILGQLVTTTIVTSLDPNSTYLLGIRARTAHAHRSELITNHVLVTDGFSNIFPLPGEPNLLRAINLASAGLRVFWEYTDNNQAFPNLFSIRLDGVEVGTLAYSSTKGKYEKVLTGLSTTLQRLTIVSVLAGGGNDSFERISNSLSVLPSSNIPTAPDNLTLRQV